MCNEKSPLSAPPPVFEDDIFKLNVLALNSFILAFMSVKPKVVFICDFCPKDKYDPLLEKVPFEKEIIYTELGINGTCLLQYDMAQDSNEDIILFQEDDYLYLPQVGGKVESAISHFSLISPYDHLNFYKDHSIHSKKTEIELFEDHHWRTVERNTMTFGMTKETLNANYDILKHYGYLDNEVWKEMLVNGCPLRTPIPSFATHLVKDWLSPGINWQQLWKLLAPELNDKPKP